jgi:hypothetical protein
MVTHKGECFCGAVHEMLEGLRSRPRGKIVLSVGE